jgi:hypothetical protein
MLVGLLAVLLFGHLPARVDAQIGGRVRIHAHDPVVSGSLRFDADEARRGRGATVYEPRRARRGMRGRAGGRLPASALGLPASCPGFFSEAAQHTVVLPSDASSLEIRVESSGPATLALVAPDGSVWCDASATPSVRGYFVAGVYRIYVGSHAARRPPRYTLRVEEVSPVVGIPTPPPAPMPTPAIDPRSIPGTYTGRHPHWTDSVTIAADGTYARGNGDPGRWWIEGTTLVLGWTNWGPERLELQADGSFRASSNGFTLARGVIVVSPPVVRPPVIVRPPVVVTPPAPSCRATLLEMGHAASALMFCDDALEPACADALLRAGHAPSALMFCRGVEPSCAVQLLRRGDSPTALSYCAR